MRKKCIVRSFQQRLASTGSPPRRGGVWGSGRAVAAQIKTVATPTGGDRPRRPSLAKALRQTLPGEQGKGPSPGPQKRTSLGGRLLPSKPGSRTTRRKHDALRFSPDRPTSSKSRCSRPGQRGTPRTPRRPGAENAGPLSVDHGHSSGELSRPCVAGAQNWPRVRALHESKGLER